MIDGGLDLGAVALIRGDGGGQFAVGGADVFFESGAGRGETVFDDLEAGGLFGGQIEVVVDDVVQAGRGALLRHPSGPEPDAGAADQGRQKGGQGDGFPAGDHWPASSRNRGEEALAKLNT
ncbi:hypothetical protein D3C87_1713710 [compost metagenome]